MNNLIILLFFATTMEGTVDQIYHNRAIVEISAKDGHSHSAEFPVWLFPCEVKEGLQFSIHTGKSNTAITCR
jgi:hypothetical protein